MLSIEKQMLFLLSRTDAMDAQEMIRVYEGRGYSAPYIRNALSRLKKEAYVNSPSRSSYCITDAGRSFIVSINQKPELYNQMWDGSWHFVLTSFPETERRKRDQFRTDLLQTGYGQLYSGVYLSPWPFQEATEDLLQKHESQPYVTTVHGTLGNREISPEEAAVIWSLDEVQKLYEERWKWFKATFCPELEELIVRGAEPLDFFIRYLHLGEMISELYLRDPMLPEALLPKTWTGRERLQGMRNTMERIVACISPESAYSRFVR